MNDWHDASRYELARLYAALMLAPTVELVEALLWSERVPHTRLSPWVTRLADRESLGERVCLDDFHLVPS